MLKYLGWPFKKFKAQDIPQRCPAPEDFPSATCYSSEGKEVSKEEFFKKYPRYNYLK